MRTHTNAYKTSIKGVRQIDTILKNIDTDTIISNDNLVKVKPILNAELLKSAMKQLDIESKIDIPLNTILNFKQGVLVNNAYEYLDYGNYVVYESEYQADTKSYVITCYDKMLYSMIDYVTPIVNDAPITYPITIKNYLIAIATHLGLEFEDSTFTNQNKEIPNELYLDSFGRSLGYTFRDVLDELSQVTASCICINSNDKIEVRYINENLTEISNKVGSNITETTIKAPIQLNGILGDMEQNGTPSPSTPIDIDVVTGLQNVTISDGNNTEEYEINLGNIELCKINDYQDKIYKSNGKWYIEKNITKTEMKTTDIWVYDSNNVVFYNMTPTNTYNENVTPYCNYFEGVASVINNGTAHNQGDGKCCFRKGTNDRLYFNKFDITSLNDFKTWLSSHPTFVYYVLATPETTEITNTELINQLNALYNAKSNNGITNIIVYGDLSAILDVNLGKSRETINEDYLKNINVTFGEKYGPVNSIVLSRSAGSDNIYKKDDTSIEENGLCELKISDNQIMNFNDRDAYLNEIFDRLNGLEYFINDFDSPGITYLELLDKYDIQVENDTYTCILLNDGIEINKGISERIFTDKLEDSKTDYTKSDKTDRKINQAYIIVDKQNQTITALTSRTNDIENNETNHYNELVDKFDDYAPLTSIETITNQVTQLQTDTYTKTQIQEIANGTGVDGVTVTAVISTEAQFDKDGMHYSKTDAPTTSTIDYKGFEVDDKNGKEIFYAGYDEDDQSPTYGTSIVRTDNINVDTYLQFGNNKGRFEEFEDADGNIGIGLFLM